MRQNELLLLVVSCFVLVVIWIGFNLYHAHADSTITETQQIQVEPITPEFNRGAIEALKARMRVEPLFEASAPLVASTSPVVTPTKPTASQSATTTPVPKKRATP